MFRLILALIAVFSVTTVFAAAGDMPAPKVNDYREGEGAVKIAHVKFAFPQDGAIVNKEFTAKFLVEGLQVKPAGAIEPGSGHFHVIIDGGPVKGGEVVPTDEKHLHFGKAQTEAKLTLKPGKHTLTLQFADGAHRAYSQASLSETITITVK